MSDTIDTEIFELFKDDSKNNIKRRRINSLQDTNYIPFKVEVYQEEKYSPISSPIHFEYEYKTKLKNHPNEDIRHLFSIHFENNDNIVEPKNISLELKNIFETRSGELKALLTNRLKNFFNSSLEKQKKFIPENIIEEHIYKRTFKELNKELLNSSSITTTQSVKII